MEKKKNKQTHALKKSHRFLNAQQVCAFGSVLFKNSEDELVSSAADAVDLRENYYNKVKLTGLSSP